MDLIFIIVLVIGIVIALSYINNSLKKETKAPNVADIQETPSKPKKRECPGDCSKCK